MLDFFSLGLFQSQDVWKLSNKVENACECIKDICVPNLTCSESGEKSLLQSPEKAIQTEGACHSEGG